MSEQQQQSFQAILGKYAAAHCQSGTDKTTSHSYGELYDELFAPLRASARRVLEIGVYSGASVVALAEYFEGAEVHGVDVTLDNVRFGRDHPRVRFHLGDGTLAATAAAVAGPEDAKGPFDLILDDGSHRILDQLAVLETWAPHLRPGGGLLVIEDIAVAPDAHATRAAFEAHAREAGLELASWHDRRWIKNQFDDVVAVFRKPDSAPPNSALAGRI